MSFWNRISSRQFLVPFLGTIAIGLFALNFSVFLMQWVSPPSSYERLVVIHADPLEADLPSLQERWVERERNFFERHGFDQQEQGCTDCKIRVEIKRRHEQREGAEQLHREALELLEAYDARHLQNQEFTIRIR